MWSSLIRIQKLIQQLRPLRVIFTDDQGFFENPAAKGNLKVRIIDRNLVLIVIASIIGLKRVLGENNPTNQTSPDLTREQIKIQTQKMVLGGVLLILYTVIFLVLLVTMFSFKYRSNSGVFMMSQARALHLDRKRNPGKTQGAGAPTKRESVIFGALIYNLMTVCFVGLAALTVFPLASRNNPGRVILSWLLPENIMQGKPILIKLISCVYIGISTYFGIIPVIQAFSYMTAVLFESKYILKQAFNNLSVSFTFNNRRSAETFCRQWNIYAQNVLYVRAINSFGHYFYPGTMLTGFCVNVVTTMVCMKFYEQLPAVVFLLFFGFDIVTAVATAAVHSFAVVAKEESERFRRYWKSRLFGKLARKQLRACIPTGINIGPFFPLQRSTLLNTVIEAANMVVTLLLLDE